MCAVVFLKYTERERESCDILSIIVTAFVTLQVVNVEKTGARDWATQLLQEPKSGRNDEGHDSWHYRHSDDCGKEKPDGATAVAVNCWSKHSPQVKASMQKQPAKNSHASLPPSAFGSETCSFCTSFA